MKIGMIALVAVLLALALGGREYVNERNKLAAEKEAITVEWSKVAADVQRRADLIPGLVETVGAYAKQETTIMESLGTARGAVTAARTPQDKIDASNRLTGVLGRVLVVAENYPKLKASDSLRQVQVQLEEKENAILQSRRRYNDAVQRYNTDISLFPANVAAALSGLQREDAYFKTEPGADRPRELR